MEPRKKKTNGWGPRKGKAAIPHIGPCRKEGGNPKNSLLGEGERRGKKTCGKDRKKKTLSSLQKESETLIIHPITLLKEERGKQSAKKEGTTKGTSFLLFVEESCLIPIGRRRDEAWSGGKKKK